MLKGRQRQAIQLFRARGQQGLTVIEAMELGLGTELRRIVTTLIRKGFNIQKDWQHKGDKKFIKYVLIEQPRVMTIVDPMNGNKQEVLI
jgi:hypothetical protein